MPHIYPHKVHGWRVRYRIWFPDGRHRDKAKTARKKALAQLIFREVAALEDHSRRGSLSKDEIIFHLNRKHLTRDEAQTMAAAPLAVTWRELRVQYEDHSRRNCAPYTHACNMSRLDTLMEFFEGHDPAGITQETVSAYINKRFADRTPKGKGDDGKRREYPVKSATIAKELQTLRILLDPLGPGNPAREVSAPKKRDERFPRPLWREDIKAFLKALRGRRACLRGYLIPMAMTCLYAGLRPSEIINLTPQDVHLSTGVIIVQGKDGVRTKTGSARRVEIHPKLDVFLRSAMRRGGKFIFGGDAKQNSKSVSRALRKVITAAGIEGVTPYSLRHTFITHLLRSGADIREVMDRAGHKRLSTTMRYLHVAPSKNPIRRIKFKD